MPVTHGPTRTDDQDATRRRTWLAYRWAAFVLVWSLAVLGLGFPLMHLACNAENAAPDPGSPRDAWCDGVYAYLRWGEPSEWTTPLPYLLPVGVLAALGAYGVWRRSRRFLRDAALGAVTAMAAHFVVIMLLPG